MSTATAIVVDQNCPAPDPQAKFFVTALGEVMRGDELLGCESSCESLGLENPAEARFVKQVYSYQDTDKVCNSGRWRVYGRIAKNNTKQVVVVTEFQGLLGDESLWRKINKVKTGARLWVMDESLNRDTTYRFIGGDSYGPNHGKMERQVELSWRIEKLSPGGLLDLVTKLETATQELWKASGVGVV